MRPIVSDTLYYVTLFIDAPPFPDAGIRRKTEMSGVSRNLVTQYLSKTNPDSLLASFYRYYQYTPPHKIIEFELVQLLSPSFFEAYAKAHQFENADFNYNWDKKSREKMFWLENGVAVKMRVIRVAGKFWMVDKADPVMRLMNWNEVTDIDIGERDIQQLRSVRRCYVPYEITWYQQPPKFSLRFAR